MRYLWQHLQIILSAYDGRLPLHHFLKSYFAQHKKLGSRDRRGLSDAVYAWYRAGKMFARDTHTQQERHLAAMHICGLKPKAFASEIDTWLSSPENGRWAESVFPAARPSIFPHALPLSKGIATDEWLGSMLVQPMLFLRIRKDRPGVEQLLSDAGIPQVWNNGSCVGLPNGTPVEGLLPPDTYVVQDASSQATGTYLAAEMDERWWDCCSGAGGKSLMLMDAAPGVHLTATDIRGSILQNLVQRFRKYSHKPPEHFVLDVAEATELTRFGSRRFDGIICDVPCSGSGTWARTPEACYFFHPDSLPHYTSRQECILRNAATFLKEDGRLVYITCSVFRAENEDVLEAVLPEAGLRIVKAELINGISIGADSLFVAELRRADQLT